MNTGVPAFFWHNIGIQQLRENLVRLSLGLVPL